MVASPVPIPVTDILYEIRGIVPVIANVPEFWTPAAGPDRKTGTVSRQQIIIK
jgi:hypothetical protein